jgi:SAM-dependent methyltransferase
VSNGNDLIAAWQNAAPYWEAHRETIRVMFAPVTQALISDARIAGGLKVLDVASGPGEPALSIAEVVGPEGSVQGIDPAPEMVAAARRTAEHYGAKNARFQAGFADHLTFESGAFDAAVCRFGVMFFPSPVDGIREMLRVLKPVSKIAAAVWHFEERNPFFSVFSRVVDRFVESPPMTPNSPDPFRFAPPGKLLDVFNEAGAVRPTERLLQFKIEAPLSPEDFWTLRSEMSDKLRSKLTVLSVEEKNEIKTMVLEGLREYSTPTGMSFPAEVLIVSGDKVGL